MVVLVYDIADEQPMNSFMGALP